MPINMAWWSRPAEDTLELMFSQDGYVGVRLHLAWTGARWAGRGEAFTDVLPAVQATANGSLTPKPCP